MSHELQDDGDDASEVERKILLLKIALLLEKGDIFSRRLVYDETRYPEFGKK